MKKEDIQKIAEAAKAQGLAILERWLPGGKKTGQEYVVRNPHRNDERAGSLSINIATGKGKDFATDDAFGDFVAVVAFALACDMSSAAAELAKFIGLVPDDPVPSPKSNTKVSAWSAALPVPDDAPPPPVAHPQRGKPSITYVYRDAAGKVMGYIMRFEAAPPKFPKKDFRQLTFQTTATGDREWRWVAMPAPRPLYGLDLLAKNQGDTVFVVEGEKAAEAGRRLLPGCVSTTPGGAAAVAQADVKPLAGRNVILWPDNDAPGVAAMQKLGTAILKAGAASCRVMDTDVLTRLAPAPNGELINRVGDLPAGWDCADALADGWTPAQIKLLLARDDILVELGHAAGTEPSENGAEEKDNDGPFVLDETGLYFVETDKDGKVRQTRICAPLSIPALARDGDGGSWSPVLKFKDRDGEQRQEIIPFKNFIGDGTDGLKQLADLGLEIASGRQPLDRLKAFIVCQQPKRRARLVDQSGWHGGAYLFPEGAVGDVDEALLFRGSRRALGVFTKRGKLADWSSSIGRLADGNPRLIFCLAVGFAGPLLKPCGVASMAFHLVGDSSIGKSGGLTAAGSIWGSGESQVHSWRQTSNALEYTAAQHNDALLILDELKEVDPKEAGSIAYMLSNAKGKGRAHHAGGLRESTVWNIAMLSSGELGLGDHLASTGQKRYAGQEVRFIELAADGDAGHGMWSELHGLQGGKEFTDHLKKAAARYYGTAGRAFVGQLVKHRNDVASRWSRHNHQFSQTYAPTKAGGQVLRVMSSFSLVAFAGELATEWEIVPWAPGAATTAAGLLFEEWVRERPSMGNSEEGQIIAHVRNVLERTWQSKFVDWKRVDEENADLSRMAAVHDSLGFRKRESECSTVDPSYLFYISRGRFQEEFAAKGGFKPKRVAAVLKAHGVLKCDADAATLKETLPNGDPRSYCVIGSKLWALTLGGISV